MKRLLMITVMAGMIAAVVAPVGTAEARPRSAPVVIVADVSLPEPFEGPFEAQGPAVRRGMVCPAGELEGVVSGPGGPFYDFTVRHDFTCDDGTGTFSIDLWVRLFDSGETLFAWSVADGTGDYVDLSGSGLGIGIPGTFGENIVDYYLGRVSA